jgi:putative membrane protein
MPRFLNEVAVDAFRDAIAAIEAVSSAEVVVAVRPFVRRWPAAASLLGIACASGTLAYLLYSDPEFPLWTFLALPLAIGVAVAFSVAAVPALHRAVMPRSSRDRDAALAARALFVEREIHATRDHTGLLVYIAVLERCVVLVPDLGIRKAVGDDLLSRWRLALEAPIAQGGEAVARALGALAAEIAGKLPRRADDTNELPDAVSLPHGRHRPAIAAPS